MDSSELKEGLSEERILVMPYTVSQYHDMIAKGILVEGEPFELLGGFVIRKDRSALGENPMTVGNEHNWGITALQKLDGRLRKHGCYMRVQQPVVLPPHNEPEPDGAIAPGTEDDYLERSPGEDDVLCVIEVSDSSLRRDRTTKLRIYARHAIKQYVIVNLPDRVVEVYTQPQKETATYAETAILSTRQTIILPTADGKGLSVRVRNLLP